MKLNNGKWYVKYNNGDEEDSNESQLTVAMNLLHTEHESKRAVEPKLKYKHYKIIVHQQL